MGKRVCEFTLKRDEVEDMCEHLDKFEDKEVFKLEIITEDGVLKKRFWAGRIGTLVGERD